MILLPSDIFSQRELLVCLSKSKKSFTSIHNMNVLPNHLGSVSFDSISQLFLLTCPSCILMDYLKKNVNCLLSNSLFVYLQLLYWIIPFSYYIHRYASWKQTELVNDRSILICRHILNPKENFAEWKLHTRSLVSLTFHACGNSRFSTILGVLHSQIVRNINII